MPKVSVIIPIYGVERYISRCARSLFLQTLDDIEYIFINDCTKDNSVDILRAVLEEYPERKTQTRIIDMPCNCGLPTVRRHGIELATGDYIIHCDSDDWVEKDMYELLWNKAVEDDADIVNTRAFVSSDVKDSMLEEVYVENKEALMFSYVGVWSKLVRRELYLDLWYYPVDNMWEDRVFTLQLVHRAKKISFVDRYLYHYYINPSSICRDVSDESIRKNWEAVKRNLTKMKEYVASHKISGCEKYLLIREFCALDIIASSTKKREWYIEWKNSFPKFHKSNILFSSLPFKYKIKYYLTYFRIYPYIQEVVCKKIR